MLSAVRNCERRSGKNGAKSDVSQATFPKRRRPEQSGHAAGSLLPAWVFGAENEKSGSGKQVRRSGPPKRQIAVRPALAGRTIAIRARPIQSWRGIFSLRSFAIGIAHFQRRRSQQSQFFG